MVHDQNEINDVIASTETSVTSQGMDMQKAAEKEDMMQLYEESFNNIKPGEIIEGTIVSVTDKEVLVDIGYKSEGSINISEFPGHHVPEKFSKIMVFINAVEDEEGKLKLSKKKADFILNIDKLKKVFQANDTVTGVLRRRVKGGMIAEVFGLEAFLPGSQISLKPIPNLDQFINKEAQFKILKLDEERRNIIVSRKKVLEEEMEYKKKNIQEKIQPGAELDGEVKNITDYGAFIDLGGIDGLLHITDMSWGRINHPSEMLNIGDKLKVKVIGYDEENQRVSLGLKQLVPHPWENIEAKYPEGTKVTGKVVNLVKYGAFVELEAGVEGLIHISEMSWTKKISKPEQLVKVGDTVSAIVLSVSRENQKISLGMKQITPNPWLTVEERYPIDTIITRKIKNITPFGIFVEIEEDIDGLIHISDISWTKRIYHPKEMFRRGQEIRATVLSIDKTIHRISLGIKQLEHDPWENLVQKLPINTEVEGVVSKIIPKGLLVDIAVNDSFIEGFVPISHLAIAKLEHPELAFDMNEKLMLKVIELDMENRRLILSAKAYLFGRDKQEQIEYQQLHEDRVKNRIADNQPSPIEHIETEYDDYIDHTDHSVHAEVAEVVEVVEQPAEIECQEEVVENVEVPDVVEETPVEE